jgi:hypothetical protein
MRNPFLRLPRNFERGAVAVEAAACIGFILIPVLACVMFLGRYFWYYTVAQKAAHDAAVYMASSPLSEIKSNKGAAGLASDIIGWETGDLDSDTSATVGTTVMCGYKLGFSTDVQWFSCSSTLTPIAVRTGVIMNVTDPFLSPVTNAIFGSDGIPVVAGVSMTYVGH